jgi:hypothetical protein
VHRSRPFHDQPYSFTWGDGSPFTAADKAEWGAANERAIQRCQWRARDVLVLDNVRVMHGRLPYAGPRTMAVMLGDPHVRVEPRGASPYEYEPGHSPGSSTGTGTLGHASGSGSGSGSRQQAGQGPGRGPIWADRLVPETPPLLSAL